MQNDDYGFKKKGMTVKVINNNIEDAIIKLKRRMNSEGINKELRKRKQFSPNSVLRRQQLAEARLRWKKKYAQIMDLELPKKKIKKPTRTVNKAPIDLPRNNE